MGTEVIRMSSFFNATSQLLNGWNVSRMCYVLAYCSTCSTLVTSWWRRIHRKGIWTTFFVVQSEFDQKTQRWYYWILTLKNITFSVFASQVVENKEDIIAAPSYKNDIQRSCVFIKWTRTLRWRSWPMEQLLLRNRCQLNEWAPKYVHLKINVSFQWPELVVLAWNSPWYQNVYCSLWSQYTWLDQGMIKFFNL